MPREGVPALPCSRRHARLRLGEKLRSAMARAAVVLGYKHICRRCKARRIDSHESRGFTRSSIGSPVKRLIQLAGARLRIARALGTAKDLRLSSATPLTPRPAR